MNRVPPAMPGGPSYQNLPPFSNKLSLSNLRIHNAIMFSRSKEVERDLKELSKTTKVIHSNAMITRVTNAQVVNSGLVVKLDFKVDFSPDFVSFRDKIPKDFNELNLPHFSLCKHVCSQHIKQQGRGIAHMAQVNCQRLDADISLIDLNVEDTDNLRLNCKQCHTRFESSAKVTNNAHIQRMSYEFMAWRLFGKCDEVSWSGTWAKAFCELSNSTFLTPFLGLPDTCCDGGHPAESYFPPGGTPLCPGGWAPPVNLWPSAWAPPVKYNRAARDSGFVEGAQWGSAGDENREVDDVLHWSDDDNVEGPAEMTEEDVERLVKE
jgi:hypothetical protein